MIKIEREELKRDYPALIPFMQSNHVIEESIIINELFIKNTPVVNLCHSRTHFAIFGEFFVKYEMEYTIVNIELKIISRRIPWVIFYDDYQEYEADRVRVMSSSKPSNQTGINYN